MCSASFTEFERIGENANYLTDAGWRVEFDPFSANEWQLTGRSSPCQQLELVPGAKARAD